MELSNNIALQIVNIIFMISIGFYLMQNLQWYNYSICRVITKHKKIHWHLLYFIFPVTLFLFANHYFYLYLTIHLVLLGMWYVRLDKKLAFTARINRFFIVYLLSLIHI